MTTITEQDLSAVNELRRKMGETIQEVGRHTLDCQLLQDDIDSIKDMISERKTAFKDLLIQEEQLVTRLRETYGDGSINYETGEFTPEK